MNDKKDEYVFEDEFQLDCEFGNYEKDYLVEKINQIQKKINHDRKKKKRFGINDIEKL